jgi:ABC-type dipeptide/oligopeptide/nickel transport system ATPase component
VPDAPVLQVRDLRTYFHTDAGTARSVDGVSFDVHAGETLGVVGESGCGKSVTALSILRLIRPPGEIEPGSQVLFDGRDLITAPERELRRVRGARVAMIFQEPMTALNPVFTVGDQIAEVPRVHEGCRAGPRGRAPSRCSRPWASPTPRAAPPSTRTSSRAACASA